MKAYKYYQLLITKSIGQRYCAISTLSFFDELGSDMLKQSGVLIAADKQYRSQYATYMIDGKSDTYWEGASNERDFPMTINIELPESKAVNYLYIENNSNYKQETVTVFSLNGSDDGIKWELIKEFENDNQSDKKYYYLINYKVSGTSLQDDGKAGRFVIINDWQTADFIDKVKPNTNGDWEFITPHKKELLITHIGETGFAPQSDGPIMPELIQ